MRWNPPPPAEHRDDPRMTPQGMVRGALALLEEGRYQEFLDGYICYQESYEGAPRDLKSLKQAESRLRRALQAAQEVEPVIDEVDDSAVFTLKIYLEPWCGTGKEYRAIRRGWAWQILW